MAARKTPSKKAGKAAAPKAAASKPANAKAAAAPVAAVKAKPVKAKAATPPAKSEVKTAPAAKPAAPAPAAAVAKTIDQTIEKGTDTMNKQTSKAFDNAQAATDQVQAIFGDVNERAKTQIEKSTRVAEELTEFGKGNVEAIVAASKIAAKGVESIGQEVAEFGRKSFEEASATLRSFAEVKSPTDFFRLQSDFARSQFDSLIAESSKMSEAMIKLAGDVAEPLTSRYSVAAERVKSVVA
jgi:phasin family protein